MYTCTKQHDGFYEFVQKMFSFFPVLSWTIFFLFPQFFSRVLIKFLDFVDLINLISYNKILIFPDSPRNAVNDSR